MRAFDEDRIAEFAKNVFDYVQVCAILEDFNLQRCNCFQTNVE